MFILQTVALSMIFFMVSVLANSAAADERTVCGIYSSAAQTNWLNDGADGLDLLDSKLTNGAKFPTSFGGNICITGVVGQLNGRLQFIMISSIKDNGTIRSGHDIALKQCELLPSWLQNGADDCHRIVGENYFDPEAA